MNGLSPLEEPKAARRFWLLFAVLSVILILAAATRWILDHPFGVHWDEALYFNQALTNIRILHSGNLYHIGGVFLRGDSERPPAYRLLVLPFLELFGLHIAAARFASLAFSAASFWFIYLGARRIAGSVAGAVAALVFCLSNEIVVDSIFFSTEGPMFLATAAMLYFLFVQWSEKVEHTGNWVGLGLALGLGFLSKASFVLIAFPVLAFVLIDAYRKRPGVPGIAPLFRVGAVAFLVAAPWWFLNIVPALHYIKYARDSARSSLGTPSFATWTSWLSTVFQGLLGPALGILIALILIVAVRKAMIAREWTLDPLQKTALIACACAGLPTVAAQLSGTNHLLRYLSPAIIPLAVAVGILATKSGWTRSRASIAISGVLLSIQLGMILAPALFPNKQAVDPGLMTGALPWRTMARFDQWDWRPVRDLAGSCGIETPRISYLGNGRAFNPPQIQYPWVVQAAATRGSAYDSPPVTWLWRYEQGPLDWQELMRSVGPSDFVITAPNYVGQLTDRQDLDNQYNAEFAERLSQDPDFQGPFHFEMGRFEPVDVTVFVKKALVCQRRAGPPTSKVDSKFEVVAEFKG